jgi:hypothetical protein
MGEISWVACPRLHLHCPFHQEKETIGVLVRHSLSISMIVENGDGYGFFGSKMIGNSEGRIECILTKTKTQSRTRTEMRASSEQRAGRPFPSSIELVYFFLSLFPSLPTEIELAFRGCQKQTSKVLVLILILILHLGSELSEFIQQASEREEGFPRRKERERKVKVLTRT